MRICKVRGCAEETFTAGHHIPAYPDEYTCTTCALCIKHNDEYSCPPSFDNTEKQRRHLQAWCERGRLLTVEDIEFGFGGAE